MANVSHNDIKPSNFLVDWPQGTTPTVSNLKVYLTDFGMVDQAGGTPVYCSPEVLTDAKPGIFDLYSLGRLLPFLVVENREIFYCLVFMSMDVSLCNTARRLFESLPIVTPIEKMTHII